MMIFRKDKCLNLIKKYFKYNKEKTVLLSIFAVAFALRISTSFLIATSGVDDAHTWWILAVETKHNDLIYTDPWGGHDKIWPPFYATVSAFFMIIFFSEKIWVPKLVSVFCGAYAVALTYLITKKIVTTVDKERLKNPSGSIMDKAPLAAALLLAFNPYHIFYTSMSINEPLYSALLLSAIYFLLKAEKANNYIFLTAVFLFFATLTRYEIWVLLPFFAWIAIKQERVTFTKFFASAIIVLSGPFIWILRQHYVYGSWRDFIEHYTSGGGASTSSATGDPFLNALFVISTAGVMTFGIAWFALIYGWKKLAGSKIMVKVANGNGTINFRDFEVVYAFFAAYILLMVASAALGIFPAWVRYHIAYIPTVFIIFGIAFTEKIFPLLQKMSKKAPIFSKREFYASLLLVQLLFLPAFTLEGKHQDEIIEAGEIFAKQYEGGTIINDLPSFIYGSGLPIEKFIRSSDIPDETSLWGEYLKSENVTYLVWTDADYAKISNFDENLIKNNETGVEFILIYATDPSNPRTCDVYKIVDYGI